MRLKELLKEKKIKQKELGTAIGYDEAEMSRVVRFRVLPTPSVMNKLCAKLGCGVLDIYEKKEINLLPKESRKEHIRNSRGYNLCVFIPEAYRYSLPAALSRGGFKTYYDWLAPYIKETIEKYKTREE